MAGPLGDEVGEQVIDLRDEPTPIIFSAPEITDGDVDAVAAVLRSRWLTTGGECLALEQELAAATGAREVVAMASCTVALETAVAALGLPAGARIGVPTWTFVSTALAAMKHDLVPVLLDVDPDTLNLAPAALEAALPTLDAVLPVHFGGVPVDAAVRAMAAASAIPVIEDAAHALGATDDRGPLHGAGSTAACFSFYATKNLCAGEGGALATDDAELARFARSYRLHGLSGDAWARYKPGARPEYDLVTGGVKGNLPDVLAALARSQLARFPAMQQRRRVLVEAYRARLAAVPGIRCVPTTMVDGSADHLMIVVLPEGVERNDVLDVFRRAHIGVSVHFKPLHRFTWLQRRSEIGRLGLVHADAMADRVLSLPLHPGLALADVDRVVDVLAGALDEVSVAHQGVSA